MSANWSISRNSSDPSPVSDDLGPYVGTVRFAAGQVTAVIPINVLADDQPEEAEAFVLRLLPNTVTGNAEVDEPMEVSLKEMIYTPGFIYFIFHVFIYLLVVHLCCRDGLCCDREIRLHLLGKISSRCCVSVMHVYVFLCASYCRLRWQAWHILQKSTSQSVTLLCGCSLNVVRSKQSGNSRRTLCVVSVCFFL